MALVPMRIELELDRPWDPGKVIHLDGLLASIKASVSGAALRASERRAVGPDNTVPLPLATFSMGDLWWWRASACWRPETRPVFWAVGYRGRLNRLLKGFRGHPLASADGPTFKGFSIATFPESPRTFRRDWRLPNGRPARNLPAEWAERRDMVFDGITRAPITPPYWSREHWVEIAK